MECVRIACAVPKLSLADPKTNAQRVCQMMDRSWAEKCDIVVFPELALTGYTCADLFFHKALLQEARKGLKRVAEHSAALPGLTTVVGLPLALDGKLYNCAAVVAEGRLLGVHVKKNIPHYGEFQEKRWFASATELTCDAVTLKQLGQSGNATIPLGSGMVLPLKNGIRLGVEICEDLWSEDTPSGKMARTGADVIVNLAASNELAGKRRWRTDSVVNQSSACGCVYALCSAGLGESSQDLVFSGHCVAASKGVLLGETPMEIMEESLLLADAALAERPDATAPIASIGQPNFSAYWKTPETTRPYMPQGESKGRAYCLEAFQIQAAGLARRLQWLGAKAVVGVSGGLDSTLALLVCLEAMKRLGRPASHIHGISMPCFGTSRRTEDNAKKLMGLLGITMVEIPVAHAVSNHFRDIGHDPQLHDTTFENAQARERTQVLMDYAGKHGGIVIGTGDLSELALGWCTFNADHMSMYSVNGSIPKTMVKAMVEVLSGEPEYRCVKQVLADILATPISPELLPPDENGAITQQTEANVGPYVLHDFFLYHFLHHSCTPKEIFALACKAFAGEYSPGEIKKWLILFCKRFFSQQYKRNCQPDGVKATLLSLNPRGDWRMPGDATARLWIEEAEAL